MASIEDRPRDQRVAGGVGPSHARDRGGPGRVSLRALLALSLAHERVLWAASAVLVGAAVVLLGSRFTGSGLDGPLSLPMVGTDTPRRAILVIHPDDCSSNLRFLQLLDHAEVRRRVDVVRIASPTRTGLSQLRERLPEWLRSLSIVALDTDDRSAFGRLGYRFGPLLLLYDGSGRLRAIEPAPRVPAEFIGLGRRLRGEKTM